MDTNVLEVDTARRRVVDLTGAVRSFCGGHRDGLCNVFVPHATAGVAIIETGSGSDDDLVDTLERLLPRDDRYRHAHGSKGHGADHLLPRSLPLGDGAGAGRRTVAGHLAKRGPGRPQPGQPAAEGPAELRRRMTGLGTTGRHGSLAVQHG
ncbi:hypothetical protein I553_10215 [Mycobacterium xenopi 4042]|uniref:YjbQ family protein n=1 Tax=Mycobacterium xenopi 4042 TaxID=1299334 RepID=X7ZK67_MYCXE|nr:hypothetical protein I553_10215 [Mycobacterium xenopi 4042]